MRVTAFFFKTLSRRFDTGAVKEKKKKNGPGSCVAPRRAAVGLDVSWREKCGRRGGTAVGRSSARIAALRFSLYVVVGGMEIDFSR